MMFGRCALCLRELLGRDILHHRGRHEIHGHHGRHEIHGHRDHRGVLPRIP